MEIANLLIDALHYTTSRLIKESGNNKSQVGIQRSIKGTRNMANNTTIIELVIEPPELSKILQNWALQSKFSIYEKNENRTIYSRNILFTTAWLSVKNHKKNARLEAWLSPIGVGPDFSGNSWLAWRSPLPSKYSIGPGSMHKKHFDLLLAFLSSKSKDISLTEADQTNSQPQPTFKKLTLVTGLVSYGAINFAVGLIGVVAATGFEETMLLDSLFNMFFGLLILFCSWILSRGKTLAVWLYGAGILLASIYSITMGHGLNYLFVAFGLMFIYQMLLFRDGWELA